MDFGDFGGSVVGETELCGWKGGGVSDMVRGDGGVGGGGVREEVVVKDMMNDGRHEHGAYLLEFTL